jgi:hypothetical protein
VQKPSIVLAGLGPVIYALAAAQKTWMPDPRPGMTGCEDGVLPDDEQIIRIEIIR